MSKSRKKTPIFGIASHSEKQDKRIANRMFRKKTKQKLAEERFDELPFKLNEVYNEWTMAKDGKMYWANAPEKAMRK